MAYDQRTTEAWNWLNCNGFAVTGPSPYTGFFSVHEIDEDYAHGAMDAENLVKFADERRKSKKEGEHA